MKSKRPVLWGVLTLVIGWSLPVWAEVATPDEASIVAQNYIGVVIQKLGSWGGADDAQVVSVEELRRGGRLLGYVCHVEPAGFLVVSRNKELAAVKAHSSRGSIDPASDEGTVDLLKGRMEGTIIAVERRIGKPIEEATDADWAKFPELTNGAIWQELTRADFDASIYGAQRNTRSGAGMNYQEGEVLLTSHWQQSYPYNEQIPFPWGWVDGEWVQYECENTANGRQLVGCVATAGAQIMRYWSWPHCGEDGNYIDHYRWSNMPDVADANTPQDQIDCVAAASWMVANGVDMNYGCYESGAYVEDMEVVFEHRRYDSGCNWAERYNWLGIPNFSTIEWYNMMKGQYNTNRPVQYKCDGHSTVGDGWYEVEVGRTIERWYHFVYGWGEADDIWYLLDDIPLGSPSIEAVVRRIRPDIDIGATLAGPYAKWILSEHFDKPTRYFDRDVTGDSAEFEAGQALQYVRPGLLIHHTGSGDDTITFHGDPGDVTEFYRGAPEGDVKARILDGSIKLLNGGSMALY